MRLIPIGLGVVAALQIVAAAAAYPVLTLAVSLAGSLIRAATSHDQGALTIFFVAGLPMAFGSLLMTGVFLDGRSASASPVPSWWDGWDDGAAPAPRPVSSSRSALSWC